MVSVGTTAKVDRVDLQKVVSATHGFARPMESTVQAAERETRSDISTVGRLKSTMAATLDAAAVLSQPQTWRVTKASSSDEAAVHATSNQAKAGRYEVGVDTVAAALTTAHTFSSIATVIGISTLKIELGSWNVPHSTFSTNPNWPKANVTLGPRDTSLERVRDKINAAGIGVIASVVTDATGSRLVLRATSTGTDNAFKVEADAGDNDDQETADVLSAMGFDPSKVSGDTSKLVQPAQDASVTIDGRQRKSSNNLVEDEATGLSLRVLRRTDQPVTVEVTSDTDAIRSDIQAFAVTYNELSRQLGAIPADADNVTIRTARDIQSRVQQAFSEQQEDGSRVADHLAGVGIRMNQGGLIEVDSAALSRALSQRAEQVEKLLSASGEDGGLQGLARRLSDLTVERQEAATAPAPAPADEPVSTSAGALFRQKLLEQYTAAERTDALEAGRADEELAIQANDA